MVDRKTVSSPDGTPIACWQAGSGPPLLLVHGGVCDHYAWHYAASLLAADFTVFTYDRRGRGESGDTQPFAVEREVEDILALLASIGRPAHLLGHSAGALLSLLAARREPPLLSLTLYEPPFVIPGQRLRPAPEMLVQIRSLLAAGDRAAVLRIAMRETVGLTENEISDMSKGPGWDRLLAVAHTVPYDWELWDQTFVPSEIAGLQLSLNLLLGTESPAWLRAATAAVHAARPSARLMELPSQGHSAMITAPPLFSRAVASLLLAGD